MKAGILANKYIPTFKVSIIAGGGSYSEIVQKSPLLMKQPEK